ncbi:unnamed protein product [Peniophora sp. CBMAI 1063]|nr:unnamed protein product [Peniophora sp. CBMAI 1063]
MSTDDSGPCLLFTVVDVSKASPAAIKIIRAGAVPIPAELEENFGWDEAPSFPLSHSLASVDDAGASEGSSARALTAKEHANRIKRNPRRRALVPPAPTGRHSRLFQQLLRSKTRKQLSTTGKSTENSPIAAHVASMVLYSAQNDQSSAERTDAHPIMEDQSYDGSHDALNHDDECYVSKSTSKDTHDAREATSNSAEDLALAVSFERFLAADTLAEPSTSFTEMAPSLDWDTLSLPSSSPSVVETIPSQSPCSTVFAESVPTPDLVTPLPLSSLADAMPSSFPASSAVASLSPPAALGASASHSCLDGAMSTTPTTSPCAPTVCDLRPLHWNISLTTNRICTRTITAKPQSLPYR